MKKSFLKKSLSVLLAGTMAVSMAGCGGGSDSGQPSSGTAGTSSDANASADNTNASADNASTSGEDLFGDEVTINVMVWDRGNAAPNTTTENNALTKWVQEQVKEKFNINVEYTAVPRSGSDDKLNIMMTGGTSPDIVFTYSQELYYNYANSGALKDLSPFYSQYGSDIEKYCSEAQDIGLLGDARYAVMKQRGEESARHIAYIRKDWLDELGMEVPKTKAELGECLQAFKDNNMGGSKIVPWGMSGRSDTEKGYLNFVGSYVDLPTDREAYIYNESYVVVAPGAKDGLKQLNEWYNAGLITQDFPTDQAEDVLKADISNGNVGFVLDDATQRWDQFKILNQEAGHETFVPVQCFDLSDGSYRNPYEQRYAMFVMIPAGTSDEKTTACMKYLNWLADPEVAKTVRFTPDGTTNDLGAMSEPTEEEKNAAGYPGTPDDLCIMNLNFDWVNDYDVLAKTNIENDTKAGVNWVDEAWYQNFYKVRETGKYRYPVYGQISEAEQTYGTDVKTSMLELVYRVICCPTDQFESTYETAYNELVNTKHLQDILDARAEYYDSQQ